MELSANQRQLELWVKEVNHLLLVFAATFEQGKFILSSCSAYEIRFDNTHCSLIFCYDYDRYSWGKYMTFTALKIESPERKIYLHTLIQELDPSFDYDLYLKENLKNHISKHHSYQLLIKKYLSDRLVTGKIPWPPPPKQNRETVFEPKKDDIPYAQTLELFNYFTSVHCQSADEGILDIEQAIANEKIDPIAVREELILAMEDSELDWLELANISDFIFLTPQHNSQAVKIDFLNLVLDLFFPDVLQNTEELGILKPQVIQILSNHEQNTGHSWMVIEHLISQLPQKQNQTKDSIIIDVIRMRNELASKEIKIKLDPMFGYCLATI
ncbi:MAG: hypothetical protein DHS20C18_14240 [Saprospiraceae bacterium]|nr:MAG: hypothetical protein DHS20C18_14240 [Saprospiraceae bacterium]